MLDGRIDTQGTLKELRTRGVLDDIAQDESLEAHKEELAVAAAEEAIVEAKADAADSTNAPKVKAPRKLIEEEHRETGTVKWAIYKTYLKASCVVSLPIFVIPANQFVRSYWTWAILFALIVTNQLLGVSEKFWIKV